MIIIVSEPPSEPRGLRDVRVTDKIVQLSWFPPSNTGGRSDITYRVEVECSGCLNEVECSECPGNIMVSPKYSGFNTTR